MEQTSDPTRKQFESLVTGVPLVCQWALQVSTVAARGQCWVRPLMSFLFQCPAQHLQVLGKLASREKVSQLVRDQSLNVLKAKCVESSFGITVLQSGYGGV